MSSLDHPARQSQHAAIIESFLLTYKPDDLGGFENKAGRKAPAESVRLFFSAVAAAI